MNNYTVTVGLTPTKVWTGKDPAGDELIISTVGTGRDVHFGGSAVTTTDIGFRIANSTNNFVMKVPFGKTLYAVVATTASPLYFMVTNGTPN